MFIRSFTPLAFAFVCAPFVYGQWECPTRLGASLSPIGNSNIMWANEFTTSIGTLSPYTMANAMDFIGFDYSNSKNTVYAEGGVKSWVRLDTSGHNQTVSPGLRELFYKRSGETISMTLGIQSAQGDDYLLINERMVGGNLQAKFSKWDLGVMAGSVLKHFARNGTFCSVGYLYSVVPRRERPLIGVEFGQTNFALVTASYHPNKEEATAGSLDEFSSEFSSSDTESESSSKVFSVNTIGAVAYDEFGSWTGKPVLINGVFSELAFWEDWKLKPEILYQSSPGKAGLIYSVATESQITWSNGFLTKGIARYIGFHAIDSGARSSYSFSNVFAGEILRLDAMDAPFLQVGVKQSFPEIKTSIKLQMARQIGQPKLSDVEVAMNRDGKRFKEYDATLSKTFGEHFLVNLTGGFVDYYYLELPVFPSTTDYYYGKAELFGKLEVRLTF